MEVVSVLLFFYLLMLAFAVLSYVFQSLGMYTIAKRRGIHNPWLAWVPVGSSWLLGSISDQYHYVAKGEERSKRKVLLGLQIAFIALYIAFVACWIWAFGNLFMEAFASGGEQISDTQVLEQMMAPIMAMYAVCMVISVLSIVLMVFQYIALYDLYTSCNPENNVLFLVLSIVLGVVQPFLIFAVRNKDLGMPPRQPRYYHPPVQPQQPPVWQPPVQPQQPPVWQPPVAPQQPPVEQPPVQQDDTNE